MAEVKDKKWRRWFIVYSDVKPIQEAFKFDSVLNFEYSNDGKVLSVPIEEGSFATYNKTISPATIKLDVAINDNGEKYQFLDKIVELQSLQDNAVLLTIAPPYMIFKKYTLESFSYSVKSGESANIMTVSLSLVQVKEVEAQYTTTKRITKSKKPSDTSTKDNGKQQAKPTSLGYEIKQGAIKILPKNWR